MNMKAKLLILGVLSVFAMAFVSSCKDEESFVKAESVSISPAKVTLTAGEHTELTATVAPNNATSKYFKWASSDAKVASVDNFGRVVALSPGSTTITVTTDDDGFKATSEIIVNPKPVQSVSFDKAEITVYENETATLVAIVNPSDATDQSVTWSTSDKDIATVDKNGVVTGQATGEAVVTATTTDGGKTASCKVKVEARVPTEPEQLELWKNDKAGYRPIIGGDASVDKGWLTYKDGVVRWTENTTGSPRTATIEFTTGSRITVTQLSPADFKGSWTLYSKLFDPNKTLGKGNVNADKTTVTFGNPLNGETLADANGAEHVNNVFSVAGLLTGTEVLVLQGLEVVLRCKPKPIIVGLGEILRSEVVVAPTVSARTFRNICAELSVCGFLGCAAVKEHAEFDSPFIVVNLDTSVQNRIKIKALDAKVVCVLFASGILQGLSLTWLTECDNSFVRIGVTLTQCLVRVK